MQHPSCFGPLALAALSLLSALLAARSADANGRFPAAGQVVFHPNDPEHLLLATTFGVVESRDGGQSFTWICEAVLGLSGTVDTSVAITESGVSVVANNSNGIVTGQGPCGFTASTDWSSEVLPDLTLSRSSPRQLFTFTARVAGSDRFESSIQHSANEGQSWQAVSSLPDAFLPVTIDVAPSDSQRVYVSARVGSQEDFVSVLFRSDNGGATFARAATIPDTENLRLAFIAGVHPTDADLLYLRVDHPDGTRLLRSSDGGASVEPVYTAVGPLLGFAIAESELAFGGPEDGIWTGDPLGVTLEQRSDLGPRCLAYGPGGLYACADARTDGFSLGRSTDSGQTFEPLLELTDLCGSTACGADTQVGAMCPMQWNELAPRIGTSCGVMALPNGGSGPGGTSAAGGSPPPPQSDDDGSCSVGDPSGPRGFGGLSLLAVITFWVLRRQRPPATQQQGIHH